MRRPKLDKGDKPPGTRRRQSNTIPRVPSVPPPAWDSATPPVSTPPPEEGAGPAKQRRPSFSMPRVNRDPKPTLGWRGQRHTLIGMARGLHGTVAVLLMGYRSRKILADWGDDEKLPLRAIAREMLRTYQSQMALQRATSDGEAELPEMISRHPEHIIVGQPVTLDEPAFLVVVLERAETDEASVAEVRRLVARPPVR